MAVSPVRWLVRIILVLMIILTSTLGFMIWRGGQSDTLWNKAQEAMERQDYTTAEIHLKKLILQNPRNAQYQMALADLRLAQARQEDPSITFASQRELIEQLMLAADLAEDNVEYQKKLLTELLKAGGERLRKSIQVASRVHRIEPNNVDAIYVLARQAYDDHKLQEASELADQMVELEQPPSLRTLAFKAELYARMKDEAGLEAALQDGMRLTDSLDIEELVRFNPQYQQRLMRFLEAGVLHATNREQAQQRMDKTLAVLERLAENSESDRALMRQIGSSSSTAFRGYIENFSTSSDDAEERQRRQAMAERVERLGRAALAADAATPTVYWTLAAAAFQRGDREQGYEIINRGIASAVGLPESELEDVLPLHRLACEQLLVDKRFQETRPHLRRMLRHERYQGLAHLMFGVVAMTEGKNEEALEHYLQAQQELGPSYGVNLCLGQLYTQMGEYEKALPYLERLHHDYDRLEEDIELTGVSYLTTKERVHLTQARAYFALDRWDQALEHLEMIRRTELEAEGQDLYVSVLWEANRRSEALDVLEKARTKFPDNLLLVRREAWVKQRLEQHAEARQLLQDFASTHPDSLEAQLAIVQAYKSEERLEEALEMLGELRIRFPDESKVLVEQSQIYLLLGEVHQVMNTVEELRAMEGAEDIARVIAFQVALRLGNVDEASRLIDEISTESGQNLAVLKFWEGQVKSQQGDLDGAIDAWVSTLSLDDVPSRRLLVEAMLMYSQKHGVDAAASKVEDLLARVPSEPALLMLKADLAVKRGRMDEAFAALDSWERLEPNSSTIPYHRGQAWLSSGNPNQALPEFQRALALNPDNLPAQVAAARAHLMLRDPQEALRLATGVLRRDPMQWDVYGVQVEALRQLGRHDEELAVAKKLVESQPDRLSAHRTLFDVYYLRNDIENALAAAHEGRLALSNEQAQAEMLQLEILALCRLERFEQLDSLQPNSETVAFMKARSWAGLEKPDRALAELENALKIRRDFLEARVLAAQMAYEAGRDSEALAHCVAAIGQNRDLPAVYLLQARVLDRMERKDDAVRVLRSLVDRQPKLALGYVALAETLADGGNNGLNRAIEVLNEGRDQVNEQDDAALFQKQLDLLLEHDQKAAAQELASRVAGSDPSVQVCILIARSFVRVRDFDQARRWVETAEFKARDDERALVAWMLGDIAMAEGQITGDRELLAEARDQFARVVELDRTNLVAANNLALLLGTEFGQPDDALKVMRDAAGNKAFHKLNPQIIDTIARVMRRGGKHDECETMLRNAMVDHPDHPLLQFQLGMVLAQTSQDEPAIEMLKKALEGELPEVDQAEAKQTLQILGGTP